MDKHGPDVKNLIDARRQAESHSMFVAEKSDCYLLYRQNPHGRPIYVGCVTTTQALLSLVKKAAATARPNQPAR